MRYFELTEDAVPSPVFAAAKRAQAKLSYDAKRAIEEWENANWIGGRLEQHFAANDEVMKEIITAFEPVRRLLPPTVALYRGITHHTGYDAWQQKILDSWTSDLRVAEIFAGLRDNRGRSLLYTVLDQKTIDRIVAAYERTGFAKVGRRRYIRNKDNPRYYNIYDGREFITDGDNLRRDLENTAKDNMELNQDRLERGQIFQEEVDRDRIIWLSNVRDCKEFIIRKSKLVEMRTDSQEYNNLDVADRWLAKYTYENLDKWPSRETLNTLLARYPNKTALTLYRGINFRTKEQYDEFMTNTIKGSTMTLNSISSWGRKFDAAKQFAIVQPTYFPDRETFRQEKLAQDAGEVIRGYCGLVLETHVETGAGIDVNTSKLGHEDEIILPPGTYKVTIHQIKTFKQEFDDGDDTLDNFIHKLSSADDLNSQPISDKWNFILRSKARELTEQHKLHIFNLFWPDATKTRVKIDGSPYTLHGVEEEMFDTVIWFGYNAAFFDLWKDGLFPENMGSQVKKAATVVIRAFLNVAKQHPKAYFRLRSNLGMVSQLSGRSSELSAWVKNRYGTEYNELNSRENNKMLTTERDIRHHTNKIEVLFKQMMLFVGKT